MDYEKFIEEKSIIYKFSFQDKRELIKCSRDLQQWDEGSIEDYWDDNVIGKSVAKTAKQKVLNNFYQKYLKIRNKKKLYTLTYNSSVKKNVLLTSDYLPEKIMGKCPVASEKTRCCNLDTIDIVKQCGFGCSYCSIQSFYDTEKIVLPLNLKERLASIEKSLDKNKIYHFGTGQSSDSLMFGNDNNILDDLFSFAKRNSNVVLELKTKSSNIDYLLKNDIPKNVITTWSINTQIIVENEEHLTASLNDRLKSAKQIHDKGALVGFHFHPIIYYENFEDDYKKIINEIQSNFTPNLVALISLGTLTFIKPVIKKIRESKIKSKILQMDLTEIEGKFSYPLDIKEKLFSSIYNSFNEDWKKNVFFYMCMEDITLWKKVFGYEFNSNDDFENAMKKNYLEKITKL